MRDNEPLVDIPSVAPDGDEIASYNERGGVAASGSARAGLSGGAKFFLFLTFLLAAAALAAAGYLYQELEKRSSALTAASERIGSLEDRLSTTDESVNESAAVQAVKIKELTSEVDKLWASAWRRNQAEIGEYGKKLGAAETALAAVQKSFAAQQKTVTEIQTAVDGTSSLSAIAKEAQSASIAHAAQLSELEENLASLRSAASSLESKNNEISEWIESFNTFRRQTNGKISQLESAATAPRTSPMELSP